MIWPQVACTDCGARAGEPCRTVHRNKAGKPHASRLVGENVRVGALADQGVADFRSYQERRAVREARRRRIAGE